MSTPEELSKQESDGITRRPRDANSELPTVKWRRESKHGGLVWSRKASWRRWGVNCLLKGEQRQQGRRGAGWTQPGSQVPGLSRSPGA